MIIFITREINQKFVKSYYIIVDGIFKSRTHKIKIIILSFFLENYESKIIMI